ncbi:MAG: response regulator transcription factor [Flavobacteriales bacterium]|nr:response regulator transcription factor [Flavobacteriales bacterium]
MPHDLALVDDHHLMRSGLATMLNGLDGYRVTIEAANGRELIEALRDATPPAIAIVDLNMPVMDGYATIAWLRTNAPEILPLALTFDAGDDALVRAMRAGARGSC